MQSSFQGKNIVIFGASGGVGSALARRLSAAGARLVLAGRSEEKLSVLASELSASAVVLDASRFDEVQGAVDTAVQRLGGLDGVANCVGSILLKAAHQTSEAELQQVMASNLNSAFAVVRAASKAMFSSGGSIVLVSSAAARIGLANHEAIAAAKAAVAGLTLSAAATYASRGIRVNCVSPGLVQTPLTSRITSSEASLQASLALHPLRKIGQPDDVASAIAWFLDPAQHWVTGQVLGVDGGLADLKTRV